ncbi:MAG: phosphate acyltransferase PlsX [Planctomyces sp.]|nr:phosphate acyltransferase PlsX [Planctomyces sp.]
MARVALDAMGGDVFPGPNVEGAIKAIEALPGIEVVLVGDAPLLASEVQSHPEFGRRLTVHAADGYVGMDEKPTEALRKKPNCSLSVCWQLMAAKSVDAVVSAGHTGAVVAAGLRTRLFLKNVRRPGIAVVLPTMRGRCVLMDVGANPAARPEHLLQYGIMGAIYARNMLGVERPSVGLMNIGSEDGKGNDLVREAQELYAKSRAILNYNYVGNVEGRDLYEGRTDVVICEGFVGNVILKSSEGIVDMLFKTVGKAVVSALDAERGKAIEALQALERKYVYHESGGAPLLGVDGNCIICHGSSNGHSIFNALKLASDLQARGINGQICDELEADLQLVGSA